MEVVHEIPSWLSRPLSLFFLEREKERETVRKEKPPIVQTFHSSSADLNRDLIHSWWWMLYDCRLLSYSHGMSFLFFLSLHEKEETCRWIRELPPCLYLPFLFKEKRKIRDWGSYQRHVADGWPKHLLERERKGAQGITVRPPLTSSRIPALFLPHFLFLF